MAHLSLEAVHRRGWGSLYAALAEGRVDSTAPWTLLAQHPLDEGAIDRWSDHAKLAA